MAKSEKSISVEGVPGSSHRDHDFIARAPYQAKQKVFARMSQMFASELRTHTRVEPSSAEVVAGGWTGQTNPSCQLYFAPACSDEAVETYAIAMGLIWRQDAVAVTRFNPDGARQAIRIFRKDGKPFTPSQIRKNYAALWEADPAAGTRASPNFSSPAVGFTEHHGSLVFINTGDMSDEEWERALLNLLETAWSGDYDFDRVRVDFRLIAGGKDGALYRQRLRKAGRSDLLHWIDRHALPAAKNYLQSIDWKTGKASRQR